MVALKSLSVYHPSSLRTGNCDFITCSTTSAVLQLLYKWPLKEATHESRQFLQDHFKLLLWTQTTRVRIYVYTHISHIWISDTDTYLMYDFFKRQQHTMFLLSWGGAQWCALCAGKLLQRRILISYAFLSLGDNQIEDT